MKAARIISATILGFTIALFSLWWGFIRAPGPGKVCDHIMTVTLQEAGDQSLSEQSQAQLVESMRESCIQHKHDKLQLRGRIKYAEYAKCVVDSTTLAEIGRC